MRGKQVIAVVATLIIALAIMLSSHSSITIINRSVIVGQVVTIKANLSPSYELVIQ